MGWIEYGGLNLVVKWAEAGLRHLGEFRRSEYASDQPCSNTRNLPARR